MTNEILDVRLEGYDLPVGNLIRENDACYFSYSIAYMNNQNAVPISLSMPLTENIYGDQATRAYFDNLLPENNQLQSIMDREGIARDDIVGLLKHLGGDCSGAISCLPRDTPPIKIPGNQYTDYVSISDEDLNDLMRRLADKLPLPKEIRDPSPVAGVQRKIAITEISPDKFGFPKDGLFVPTTHILKVPARGREREVQQEAYAARLARNVVRHSVAYPAEFKRGKETGLLIKRFDRAINSDGTITRIHQEDFCQALGLPSRLKYERNGEGARRFCAENVDALLAQTDAPALNRLIFMRITLFNLAIGNSDNHAKNHALIYDQGSAPRLAPLYDMLPIRLNDTFTHELAFRIGNAKFFDEATPNDLTEFVKIFGLKSEGAVTRFLENDVAHMLSLLDQSASELIEKGHKDFDDLIGREINKLAKLLGLQLDIRVRDYYAPRGGGWDVMS